MQVNHSGGILRPYHRLIDNSISTQRRFLPKVIKPEIGLGLIWP